MSENGYRFSFDTNPVKQGGHPRQPRVRSYGSSLTGRYDWAGQHRDRNTSPLRDYAAGIYNYIIADSTRKTRDG